MPVGQAKTIQTNSWRISPRVMGPLVGLFVLVALFIFQLPASLQTGYQADKLKILNASADNGFYNAEKDSSDNRYSWTSPQADLVFDLAVPKGFTLLLEAQSAAVFGGPDAPIQVVVNGAKAGEFQLDPANSNFQPVKLFVPAPSDGNRLRKIELVAQPFKPAGEVRSLGFMVKSLTLENPGWPNQPFRLNLLAGLMTVVLILTTFLALWHRSKLAKTTGYATLGLNAIGLGAVLAAALLLGGYGSWLDNTTFYLLWVFGLGLLAVIFWQAITAQPFGPSARSLYHQALDRVNANLKSREVGKIPFKGMASIEALTGLRAIAAGLVFLYHYPLTAADGLPQWLFNFTRSGNNGVPLFFTLSGFVICYNYYDRLTTRPFRNLWPFLVNRLARLYPVYLLVLGVALLIVAVTRLGRITPQVVWQQLFMLQTWNPDVRILSALVYNVPSWSVNVEIFLYLSFPLVAWLILKRCRRVGQLVAVAVLAMLAVLLLAGAFVLTGRTTYADYGVNTPGLYIFFYFPVTHLSEFISGCAAARIYVLLAGRPVGARELAWGRVALALAIAAVIFLMIFDQPYMTPFRYAAGYIPFFTIIVFCLARYRTRLSRFLSTKFLILLGEASYSFYMWHEVVLISNLDRFTTIPRPLSYLFGFGLFVVTALISIASFKLIETPSRKLIRRMALSYKASASSPAPNPPKIEANV